MCAVMADQQRESGYCCQTKIQNSESFKGCHENTTQLHFSFFLHWWVLTYIKGGEKWAPKLCVLVLVLIKTWIQITGELFQGTKSSFFWWVFSVCLFLYQWNTDVGSKETDPGKTNIQLRRFMDTDCFRAVFSEYKLIQSPELLDNKYLQN